MKKDKEKAKVPNAFMSHSIMMKPNVLQVPGP